MPGEKRFSDQADYIYITTKDFNLDTIFTDDIIAEHPNILRVFSNEDNGNIYHFNFELSAINIVMRTMLPEDQRTEYGAGFRIVLYSTGTKTHPGFNIWIYTINSLLVIIVRHIGQMEYAQNIMFCKIFGKIGF